MKLWHSYKNETASFLKLSFFINKISNPISDSMVILAKAGQTNTITRLGGLCLCAICYW
ncbi:hypothetical protein JOD18_003646 [Gracilibacillus alcaliphilus]|nr:hypothetical protein [Gracilibacillus alcaliphilus]